MALDDRPVLLLVNPTAGGGRARKRLPIAENALDELHVPFRVLETKSVEHGCEAALAGVEAGEVPVVMSGDGLIGQIGGVLAGSDRPLGILPGGRGNDLARVLGIPTDTAAAVAILVEGQVREIDVGEANGMRFLGIASAGFDSDCNRLANEVRLIRGNLVYAYSALRTLATWKPARFTIRSGDESHTFTGYTVAAANSRAYGGGMFIAPDALLDDGELDLVLIGKVSKLRFLRNLPKVFKGTHVDTPEVTVLRAPHFELRASRPFAVYADGEHLTDLPATLRVLPRALRVIAPPEAPPA